MRERRLRFLLAMCAGLVAACGEEAAPSSQVAVDSGATAAVDVGAGLEDAAGGSADINRETAVDAEVTDLATVDVAPTDDTVGDDALVEDAGAGDTGAGDTGAGDAGAGAGDVAGQDAGDAAAGGCKASSLPVGCCAETVFVWPTTGKAQQTLISSGYGPREKFSSGGAYDWHQGLDLPGHDKDGGFKDPVYAVADGELYRIGNLEGKGKGAIANFSETSGNVIVLRHATADTGLPGDAIYSLYLHVAEMKLSAFTVRIDGKLQATDLRELYYLDGADTYSSNRGKPRKNHKTSGKNIVAYPRFHKGDVMAMIGNSGSTISFEHLHFEIRARVKGASSPSGFNREWARNPYAYLPHPNLSTAKVQLQSTTDDKLLVTVQTDRDGVSRGEPIKGVQDLDVERVRLEIRAKGTLLKSREFRFFTDVNLVGTGKFKDGKAGYDHDDFLSNAHVGAGQPDRSLGGVNVRLDPAPFTSFDNTWKLQVAFSGLAAAKFVPAAGQNYAVTVFDVCGNAATSALPLVP
jgi:murein DD-endopeptidase MepM/ murein hydrolase activator NlpD